MKMVNNKITFSDLIKDTTFRKFSSECLSVRTKNIGYSFPGKLPLLYKYTRMEDYIIDNIVKNQISATRVGEFNDLFDGTLHQNRPKDFAQEKWENFKQILLSANLPELLQHDHFVTDVNKFLEEDTRLKFRRLDYLDTFVCCFSSINNSILMWSHYAASNTGICIEYDFNSLPIHNFIFPVAYSDVPIDLQELLDDKQHKLFEYSFDAAILCAALNKSSVWKYENEWRLVLVMTSGYKDDKWMMLNASIPSRVILGYHFLKPFFYYNNIESNWATQKAAIKKTKKLLEVLKSNNIPVAIIKPVIGEYSLIPKTIDIQSLLDLINTYFKNDEPENMRYYYVIHDKLMDILDNKIK